MASFAAVDSAGATDTETQSDTLGNVTVDATSTKRRMYVGVLSGLGIAAAVGLAVAMTRPASTTIWANSNFISESTHEITPNTGCSDWETQKIGSILKATSDLDCLNKCLVVAGAKYANYQDDHCDSDVNGAEKGACYCFTDCTEIANTCWDLISVAVGTTPAPSVNSTTLESMAPTTTTTTTAFR